MFNVSSDWLTVSEWALKVAELFPDLLSNAEAQAAKQKMTPRDCGKLLPGSAREFPLEVLVARLKLMSVSGQKKFVF